MTRSLFIGLLLFTLGCSAPPTPKPIEVKADTILDNPELFRELRGRSIVLSDIHAEEIGSLTRSWSDGMTSGQAKCRLYRISKNDGVEVMLAIAREDDNPALEKFSVIIGTVRTLSTSEYTGHPFGADQLFLTNGRGVIPVNPPVTLPDLSERLKSLEDNYQRLKEELRTLKESRASG